MRENKLLKENPKTDKSLGNLYHSWHVGQGPDTIGFRPREGGVKDNNGKLHTYLPLTVQLALLPVSSQRSSLASSDFGGYDGGEERGK